MILMLLCRYPKIDHFSGVVLIANFGLRGSTFPNMVAERAIPFTTTVQSLLRAELDTECQIGATFDKAYCGVVGGVSRHEYAILGPSVNLAARLMGNPKNTGFLVDLSVKEKAGGSRKFRALEPVRAKGYKRRVPIFEPLQTTEKTFKGLTGQFVGREQELNTLLSIAEDIVKNGGLNRLIIINGAPGSGKSALCLEASSQIKDMCLTQEVPHLSICTVCSERDTFVPFSVTRPLFLEILSYINDESEHPVACSVQQNNENDHGETMHSENSHSMLHLVQILEVAEIPEQFIEILGKLILTRNRADVADGHTNSSYMAMMNSIAQYIVKAFLHCTIGFDLVLLVLDDISNMDEMSWRVIELIYLHSHNTLIIGTQCESDELKVDEQFWERLHSEGQSSQQFIELPLSPIEVEQLIANSLEQKRDKIDSSLSHAAFVQPEVSNLASTKLDLNDVQESQQNKVSQQNLSESSENTPGHKRKIEEFVIHRIDRLPSSVRTYLNLGAILGPTFELLDVVTVFEQYRELRGVQTGEQLKHAKSVHESLEEAVKEGILEIATGESALHTRYNMSEHPYSSENTTYKFTHGIWISNILSLTLDEWKKEMHGLIAQSMERVIDSQLANDNRVLKRLFSHWKGSGSAQKAAALALKMGRNLEEIGLTHRSIIIYREALELWKTMDNNNEEIADETLGGISIDLLSKLDSNDTESLIKLNVSLGRCYTNMINPHESIRSFQTALNLIHKAPSSVLLEDRSIIFPVFSGLFDALRFGQNEDLQYEQGLVNMFLRETSLYKDSIHYARALSMQTEMFAKHGDFKIALETAQKLCEIYDVEEHTALISKTYGSDRCGQCISQIALWSEQLHNTEGAMDICDFVVDDLLPKMDPQNVQNLFHVLYPIIGVMKNHGRAIEASEIFEKYVIENFQERYAIHHGLTSDKPLHMPIMALLDIIGTDCKTSRLTEYSKWMLVEPNGLFDAELNFITGGLGRTADSLTAEICLLLAQHSTDRGEKSFLIRKGFKVARSAIEVTRQREDSHGLIVAYTQVKPIYEALEKLYFDLEQAEH